MKTDDFLALAGNPEFIEGIYNYCDRWCERCHMTAHCFLFATSPKEEDDPNVSEEERWEKTLQHVHDSFQITMELLQRHAEENGIDLDAPFEGPDPMIAHKQRREKAKDSPLGVLSKEYLHTSKKWMDESDKYLSEKQNELVKTELMELPDREPLQEALDIKDALEIIGWYLFQIHVKLMRAMTSFEEDMEEEIDESWPKDSDGSAKVALIGIDRSIGAWGIVLSNLPEQEERILPMLAVLERLRRMTEKQFPNARSFFRNGLD